MLTFICRYYNLCKQYIIMSAEKKNIQKHIKILTNVLKKYGRFTSSQNKNTKKNNMYSTICLMINLLLILNGKRKACLLNSDDDVINKKIILVFEEMIDLFDGTLAFEWICFEKNNILDYQIIFYNTQLIDQKVIKNALNLYDPNTEDHYSLCDCTSCNGGLQYAKKLKNILDYSCYVNKIDYINSDFYNVNFLVKYKGKRLVPFSYHCANKPNQKILNEKYKKFKPVIDCLNASYEFVTEYMGE
jgi:hypothetical protein